MENTNNPTPQTTAPLNLKKLDPQAIAKMDLDTLKKQLDQELHDADKYREATDLKEENIFLLIDTLKKSGETVDTLFPE